MQKSRRTACCGPGAPGRAGSRVAWPTSCEVGRCEKIYMKRIPVYVEERDWNSELNEENELPATARLSHVLRKFRLVSSQHVFFPSQAVVQEELQSPSSAEHLQPLHNLLANCGNF
ncbi:uncharacterized protein LJ206_002550 [Theristicus caerulescens]